MQRLLWIAQGEDAEDGERAVPLFVLVMGEPLSLDNRPGFRYGGPCYQNAINLACLCHLQDFDP